MNLGDYKTYGCNPWNLAVLFMLLVYLFCMQGSNTTVDLNIPKMLTAPETSHSNGSLSIPPTHQDRNTSILVLGWYPGPKSYMLSHLKLHQTKSFDHCYSEGHLHVKYQCDYTTDRSLNTRSHAILFRGRALKFQSLPTYRQGHQKWIFHEHEPPSKTWIKDNATKYSSLFNVSATYSLDSDVPFTTYWRHCVRDQRKMQVLQDAGVDYAKSKRTDVKVAWFVSVCKTQNEREEYVKELSKHIQVDIYGRCGPLKCGSARTWKEDNCTQKLLHGEGTYKFYLAFENSLCRDYVTEKLWKVMNLSVVPVVMGAIDYTTILPKDSFIDIRDFKTPMELAKYMMYLDENDDLYNQYIRNKLSLFCYPHLPIPWECSLCKYLHENKGLSKFVYNLESFWGPRKCIKPSHFFNQISSR